ncbi:MAG: YciI family protein [Candidatus Zixiibacteriota bacterium]
MNHYLIKYRPPRPTFNIDATDEESNIIGQHFSYLQDLLAKDILVMAGRADDAHLGIAIIKAESFETAEHIMNNDPAVKNNIFTGELHLFRLALMG